MTVKFSADRAQFLIKQEATPGNAETLAAANLLFPTGPITINQGLEFSQQNLALVDLDPQRQFAGVFPCGFRFETLIRGSGTAGTAPKIGIMMEAMGLEATVVSSTSVTYKPATPNPNGCYTMGALLLPDQLTSGNDTGVFWQIKGAVVRSLEMQYVSAMLIRCVWEVQGCFVSFTDQNAFTGFTFDSTAPLVASGLGFSIGGLSPQFRNFTFRYENELAQIDDPGAASGAEVSGIEMFSISGRRKITATYDPYELSAATVNAMAVMQANTESAFECTAATGAGNSMKLSGPKVQQIGQGHGEREKLIAPSRELVFNRSSGDDAVSIVFT